MKLLQGKTALVTGAGRGLGWGIARALGQAGASVCLTDINDEELARALSDTKSDGSQAFSLHLDVSDREAFHAAVEKVVDTWDRIDIVVHNAIYMPLTLFEDLTPADWWRQIEVGLGGLFNAAKASWEHMKAQGGGHIIGIASGSSKKGFKEEVAYCTNKHGQEGFVKALSLEAAPYQIALNTIGPGKPIKPTRITWAEYDSLSAEEKAQWADPVELGKAFVWLGAQPPSRFSGYRFDAGTIADTIAREGYDFEFSPEKATLLPEDFYAAQRWYANYPD
ncbi:MAG: SDR family oxidoreductase [Anaerolineales bacterium]|nr:SDR family oxidoreductase [Anaerolineales bacterium]